MCFVLGISSANGFSWFCNLAGTYLNICRYYRFLIYYRTSVIDATIFDWTLCIMSINIRWPFPTIVVHKVKWDSKVPCIRWLQSRLSPDFTLISHYMFKALIFKWCTDRVSLCKNARVYSMIRLWYAFHFNGCRGTVSFSNWKFNIFDFYGLFFQPRFHKSEITI